MNTSYNKTMSKIFIDALSVMSGAALGGLFRYLVTISSLPAPILIVNLVGSLIIGFTYPKLTQHFPQYTHLINTGLLGGLTTFSSFSLEVVQLFEQGDILKAFGYILIKLTICIAACLLGYRLAMSI